MIILWKYPRDNLIKVVSEKFKAYTSNNKPADNSAII